MKKRKAIVAIGIFILFLLLVEEVLLRDDATTYYFGIKPITLTLIGGLVFNTDYTSINLDEEKVKIPLPLNSVYIKKSAYCKIGHFVDFEEWYFRLNQAGWEQLETLGSIHLFKNENYDKTLNLTYKRRREIFFYRSFILLRASLFRAC